MPLDEREQRILDEIEAQFEVDDPAFAKTYRDTRLRRSSSRDIRLSAIGIVVGLVLMLVLFPQSTFLALGAFALMLASAVWLVSGIRAGAAGKKSPGSGWLVDLRQRWRRDR